jgi:hypothetical protein
MHLLHLAKYDTLQHSFLVLWRGYQLLHLVCCLQKGMMMIHVLKENLIADTLLQKTRQANVFKPWGEKRLESGCHCVKKHACHDQNCTTLEVNPSRILINFY